HALALDHERDATRKTMTLSAADQANVAKLWRQAFLDWTTVLCDEGFWSRFAQRMHELDDPRLTVASAARIRAGLPLALLSINASLAAIIGEQTSIADGARHVALMKSSGFDAKVGEEALRLALDSVRQRVQ